MLIPVPTVNPFLSNWRAVGCYTGAKSRQDVPNYHQYTLDTLKSRA